MEKIGLLIDSTTITRKDFEKFDFIKVAQLKIQINGTSYSENEVSKESMEKNIDEGKHFLTSQPAPTDFLELYREFFNEGYTHVITIVLSHGVSGTYQSAMIAKSMVDFDLEIDIHAPNAASYGLALGVRKIAEMIATGKDFGEITKRYHKLFKEPLVSFTIGSLKNLFKSGRLSRIQAYAGRILRIKPVIEMVGGKLELARKERSSKACINHFLSKIDYYTKKYKKVYLDIINIHMDEWGDKLLQQVKEKYKSVEIHLTDFVSPVFYSHLGNKGFGIAIVAE